MGYSAQQNGWVVEAQNVKQDLSEECMLVDMNWSDLFLVSSLNGNNSSIRQEVMLKGAVDPVESSIRDSMYIRMLSEVALESILTHSTPVVVVGGGTNNAVLEMWEAQELLIISPICSCVALVAVDIGLTTYHYLAVHHIRCLTEIPR